MARRTKSAPMGSRASYSRDDFEVVGAISVHEHAQVYKVRCRVDGRLYVMKVAEDERELTIHSLLKDQRIVELVYSWHEDGKVHLILEYCSRGTLYDYLESIGRLLTPNEALRIAKYVAGVLLYMKRRGVAHRDLTMDNVVVSEKGELKLCDFGSATFADHLGDVPKVEEYISPEEMNEDMHDVYAPDVWALGVMTYLLVFGTFPFKRPWDTVLIPLSIPKTTTVLPASFTQFLHGCLCVDPKKRLTVDQICELDFARS